MNLDFPSEATLTLNRLWPRLSLRIPNEAEADIFHSRCHTQLPRLLHLLHRLYGHRYDFFYHLEQILTTAATAYAARSADLKTLDQTRQQNPTWFQSEQMVGAMGYADRLASDLPDLQAKIPYFEELGLTYLHLMPLFRAPKGKNDGGFAVSSYRQVDPALGTIADLQSLATALRQKGISLVLDFVFNHTSDEHDWALKALQGEKTFQDFYLMFDDRTLPDQYEQTLREIFPNQAPGNFTFRPEIEKWVWTTFNQFQWDLNYANPAVFTAMLDELLFIANIGAEVIRLDAVAFIWKQMGTGCEGLPEAHLIVQAYNALLQIAAPATIFKSEAIVHPAEVARYIAPEEAPLSYNPTLMALLWESLATRKTDLLRVSMQHYFAIPAGCAWVNYVRCHDDIGWTFADEDAATLGINGFDHRRFLNQFYTGRFEGSFAMGLPFNYNPITGDMRISGMGASLAGLEQALQLDNELYRENALRRIKLIHAIILSVGGIPLLYIGDEIGMLNDYRYQQNPNLADDSRYVHRPHFDWEKANKRHNPNYITERLFQRLTHLITIRKSTPALGEGPTHFFNSQNPHVLAFSRNQQVWVYANFSEQAQAVTLPTNSDQPLVDLITKQPYDPDQPLLLAPYQIVWLLLRNDKRTTWTIGK